MREAYEALMLDYASGSLWPAADLLVRQHLTMRSDAAAFAHAADALGGALLEGMAPAPMAAQPLAAKFAPPRAVPSEIPSAAARIALAAEGGEGLAWRWRFPGFREHLLPVEGMSLVKIDPGRALPRHGHEGEEYTLVLTGAFSDGVGDYSVGDIAFADGAVEHQPRVTSAEACICLTAVRGRLQMKSMAGRLAARLFG